MSETPNSTRLALFTFDTSNTLTVTDPTIPPIEFDDENNLVSPIHIEASITPLQFSNENILINQPSATAASLTPETVVEGAPPIPEVVIEDTAPTLIAQHANTWPRHCPTCSHTPPQPSLATAIATAPTIDNHATLRILIDTSTAAELREMINTLQMHLSIRRLSVVPATPTPTNTTLKKDKKRWMTTLRLPMGIRMWTADKGGRRGMGSRRNEKNGRRETLSAMETAYASEADVN